MSDQADYERQYWERIERENQRESELLKAIDYHLSRAIALSVERWGDSTEYAYDYLAHLIYDARASSHVYRPRPKTCKIGDRDGWFCRYCHTPFYVPGQSIDGSAEIASVDHVIPRSKGGAGTLDNLVLACRDCNSRKRHTYTYEEFYAMTAPLRAAREQGGHHGH